MKEQAEAQQAVPQAVQDTAAGMLPAAFSGPFYSKGLALCAESGLRLYVEALNYLVIGGQERYPKQPGT